MSATLEEVGQAQIVIRSPLAKPRDEVGAPAFTVNGPLAGLRVGLRHEGSWRSWMLIVEEWRRFLERDRGKAGDHPDGRACRPRR
jgi:hypothetical protein